MRVSKQKLDEHRLAILDAAGALFRRRGIDHVSVADVTRAAGLTHGAFYGHYASKDALVSASCGESLHTGAAAWRRRAQRAREAGGDGLGAIIDSYLSERHRDTPESGCALASLGPELVRADATVRDALAGGVAALVEAIADEIALNRPTITPAHAGRAALAVLAALAGGLILARALTDPDRSRNALDAARAAARAAAHT